MLSGPDRNLGHPPEETLTHAALASLVADLEDGRGAELMIGDDYLAFDGEADVISVPIGPLNVVGAVEEWRRVLDRELADLRPLEELDLHANELWDGPRSEFHILDSE